MLVYQRVHVFCSVPVKNDQISDGGAGDSCCMSRRMWDLHIISCRLNTDTLVCGFTFSCMYTYIYIYLYTPYLIVQVLFTFMISLSQSYFYQSIIQYNYIYIYISIYIILSIYIYIYIYRSTSLIYVDMFTTAGNEDVTSSTSSHRTHRAPAKLSLVERQVLGFWDGKMQWVEGWTGYQHHMCIYIYIYTRVTSYLHMHMWMYI